MRVFLDDHPIPIATPTLAAALAAVRESAERSGRVVIEVFRDGQLLPDALLASPTDAEEPGAELRCASADPCQLVASSLRQAADELAASRESHLAAAHSIQTGKLDQAMPQLSAALAAWTQIHQVVTNGIRLIGLDEQTPIGEPPRPLADSIASLSARLNEVKRALQAQDWSGLADALAYELPDQTDHWRDLVLVLADRISAIR